MSTIGTVGAAVTGPLSASLLQLPHDPATILVSLLVLAGGVVIWYGNRQAKKAAGDEAPPDGGSPGADDARATASESSEAPDMPGKGDGA